MPSFRRASVWISACGTLGLMGAGIVRAAGEDVVVIPAHPAALVASAPRTELPTIIQVQATPSNPVNELGGAQSPAQPPPSQAVPPSVPPPWSKVPPTGPTPRTGDFIIPPTGCGYYSALDCLKGKELDKPPFYPYRGVFYDNDFRYLDDPSNTDTDPLNALKRLHLGDDWLLSIGGEERVRYMNDRNGYLILTPGKSDDYTLIRSRVYMDLWYNDFFRVYAEFYDAEVTGQDLPPLPIDKNQADFLNLFADLKLAEIDGNGLYFRIGRQELLYGSQRLVSPLEWANTRRTFQGIKGFWHSDKLDIDAFWVQPIIVNPTHFDSPDDRQSFAGFWTTYRPNKDEVIDLYYLYLDNTRPTYTGSYGALGGYNVSTVGSRYAGNYQHVLWDFEGMYQFGDWVNQNISAESLTTGVGYDFKGLRLDPQIWVYYDFASGTKNPGTGNLHETFNQLFPLGHQYFGFLDLVGRQNIEDLHEQLTFFPTKWITAGVQYHIFWLDSARDALYNAGGATIRRDPTGAAGRDVGDELDLFTTFHLSLHSDLLLGYSHLFAGSFIRNTGGPSIGPDLFYAQYSFRW